MADACANAQYRAGGGFRARPAGTALYEAANLSAIPLALPSEFIARAEIEEERHRRSMSHSRGRQHEERSRLLEDLDTNRKDGVEGHDSQKVSSSLRSPDGEHNIAVQDQDDVSLSDIESPYFFPEVTNSPGCPRLSTSRIRSRTSKRRLARSLSWPADMTGDCSDGGSDVETARDVSALHTASAQSAYEQAALQPARSASSVNDRRRHYLLIYSIIFAIAYVTSLDSKTGFLYLDFACSESGALASFSTVAICQQMIYAIAEPPIAKLSDVFGRAEAFLFAFFYTRVATPSSRPPRRCRASLAASSCNQRAILAFRFYKALSLLT